MHGLPETKRVTLSSSVYEVSLTWIPKPDEESLEKKNLHPICILRILNDKMNVRESMFWFFP